MQLGNLISQIDKDNIYKESDEIDWIDMINDKESYERDQIGEND